MGRGGAKWHQGVVTKVYPANFTFRGRPYTHDAKIDGSQEVRGVNLTVELEEEGIWVALQPLAGDVVRGDVGGDSGRERCVPRRRRGP